MKRLAERIPGDRNGDSTYRKVALAAETTF
jgi:hypothetical protein